MRKNKFICLMGVVMLSLCGCEDEVDDNYLCCVYPDYTFPQDLMIGLTIYDENKEEELYSFYSWDDYMFTLYTNMVYIFEIYIPIVGPFVWLDTGINFECDDDYISIEDYDEEDQEDFSYRFIGLQETDGTELIISHTDITRPKITMITLVDNLEIES
ncbi:MAG: hypothetical protein LUB56_02420, partial [Coprobacillus sp.]|nr:hypothetical protein [Coprobacillus sp.]